MPSLNQITVSQLNRLIGTPGCPELIDVCTDEDFNADPRVIPGAFRHPFNTIAELAPVLTGKNVVAICQKGLKLSAGAAAILRTMGINAEYLEGGNYAWRDAGAPLVPALKIPRNSNSTHSLWVTRHRPKIDRIACPWLIRRFIDPKAQFLFVAPSEVLNVAERFDATPFDIEGALFFHRNEKCTFDVMLEEFKLETEPLVKIANIIRAADTDRIEGVPEAPGLLAISLGLSRMYKDDLEQVEAGAMVYDALYRWARDASDETHQCPNTSGAS